MPRGGRYTSSGLHGAKQSTGGRPLIVLCLVSVLLLTFYLREGESGPLHTVRGAAMTLTSPVRAAGNLLATPFAAVGGAMGDATASQDTLSRLKKENEKLTAKVAELTEAQKTNERLEGLVGLKSTYGLKSTGARIIGTGGDAWSDTVVLDKGTTSGLGKGMPVCGSGGVIGQIVEVSATTSTVRLITDEQSGISAMVQSSRAQGMLQGRADGSLVLSYVSSDADVSVGDIVITSGIGGVFPKGLPLGTVSSVDRDANATYLTVTVRAASTAESNEEVLVVTSVEEDQLASDDDVASANDVPEGSAASDSKSGSGDDDGGASDSTGDASSDGDAGADDSGEQG